MERKADGQGRELPVAGASTAYLAADDDALLSSPVTIAETDIETPYGVTHVLTAGEPGHPALAAGSRDRAIGPVRRAWSIRRIVCALPKLWAMITL